MYKLLDGKIISDKLLEEYKSIIKNYKDNNRTITLCDIYVGDDPASNVYIKSTNTSVLSKNLNEIINRKPIFTNKSIKLPKTFRRTMLGKHRVIGF